MRKSKYTCRIAHLTENQWRSKKPHVDVDWMLKKAARRNATLAKFAAAKARTP